MSEAFKPEDVDASDPIYTPSQLHDALIPLIKAGLPVLVTGRPGQGKTDIIRQVCAELDYDLLISHPVVDEPIDYKGFPFAYTDDQGNPKAAFIPFDDLEKMVNATKPTLAFADDAGHAPKSVQAAYMQLLLNRAIDGKQISKHVTFVAASNRKEDKAGVQGFLEPLKDRFVTIMELVSSRDDWIQWAIFNKLPFELISWVRYVPEVLNEWEPTTDFSRLPTPRGIYGVARMIQAGMPEDLRLKMIAGAIGKTRAVELDGFLKIYQDLVDPDEVIKDPMGAEIPTEPGHCYALCGALANRANKKTLPAIIQFANRFSDPNEFPDGDTKDDFSVLLVRDAVNQDRHTLCQCKEFIDWMDQHQDVLI
jgi:hypothetical protein